MAKRRDEVKSNVKKLQKKKSQDSSILEIFRGRPDVMVGILLMICMLSFVVAPAIQTMMDGSSRFCLLWLKKLTVKNHLKQAKSPIFKRFNSAWHRISTLMGLPDP